MVRESGEHGGQKPLVAAIPQHYPSHRDALIHANPTGTQLRLWERE